MEIGLQTAGAARRYRLEVTPEAVLEGVRTLLISAPVAESSREWAPFTSPAGEVRATVTLTVDELLTIVEHAPPVVLWALRGRLRHL